MKINKYDEKKKYQINDMKHVFEHRLVAITLVIMTIIQIKWWQHFYEFFHLKWRKYRKKERKDVNNNNIQLLGAVDTGRFML